VPDRHAARREVDGAEGDRQSKAARADGARVEHGEAAVDAGERDVGMTAYDEGGIFGGREAGDVGAELRSVDGHMGEEDAEAKSAAGEYGEGHEVRKLPTVDVSADGRDGGMPFEAAKHVQVADVAAVEDTDGSEGADARVEVGVRPSVGVGDDDEGRGVAVETKVFADVFGLRGRRGRPLHGRIMHREESGAAIDQSTRARTTTE
jgi:hypothetical protein